MGIVIYTIPPCPATVLILIGSLRLADPHGVSKQTYHCQGRYVDMRIYSNASKEYWCYVTLILCAHHRGGIANTRIQINNYPACIITKSYFR